MQFLSYLLFQIDEARRYIEDGRLQHLRLACLLLDNAAEIQMDHRIKEDLQWENAMEKIRSQCISLELPPERTELRELVEWKPLSSSEKRSLDRDFNEKVSYMEDRGGHLDPSLAGPLKYLHKYRNEAYHRVRIRPETIRTASLMMLEINCTMLLEVRRGSQSHSSNGDYSWLINRFNLNELHYLCDAQLRSLVSELRSELLPTDNAVAETLSDHLGDRFSMLYDSLDFIAENCNMADTREQALAESESYAFDQRTSGRPAPTNKFVSQYSLQLIEQLQSEIPNVRNGSTRLSAFDCFSNIEKQLEPIEECVDALVEAIDSAISLAIDVARGK